MERIPPGRREKRENQASGGRQAPGRLSRIDLLQALPMLAARTLRTGRFQEKPT